MPDRPPAVAAVLGSGGGHLNICKGSYTPTPSDTDDLPKPGALVFLTDGDVTFIGADGVQDTWAGMKAGDQIPVLVTRVVAATASVKVLVV